MKNLEGRNFLEGSKNVNFAEEMFENLTRERYSVEEIFANTGLNKFSCCADIKNLIILDKIFDWSTARIVACFEFILFISLISESFLG